MPKLLLKLTDAQAARLARGERVMVKGNAGSVHEVEVDAATYKRVTKAQLANKGCLVKGDVLHSSVVEGGRVNLTKIGNQIAKGVKKGAYKIGDDMKDPGRAVEQVKRVIPEKYVSEGLGAAAYGATLAATTYAGSPSPAAANVARKGTQVGVKAAYKTDWSKGDSWQKFGSNLAQEGGTELGKAGFAAATGGAIGRRGRFPKGSQAAKDHMAKLRAMKGGGMRGKGMLTKATKAARGVRFSNDMVPL